LLACVAEGDGKWFEGAAVVRPVAAA
jgi:hypothetical protein